MISTKPSLLISSPDPENLIGFYSFLVDGCVSEGFSKQNFYLKSSSSININVFKPSSKVGTSLYTPPPIALCFEQSPSINPLSTLRGLVDEVIAIGAKLIEPPKLDTFGAEAWLYDLDDNKFLIFVPLADISEG